MNAIQNSLDKVIKKKNKYEIDEDVYNDLINNLLKNPDSLKCLLHSVNNMLLSQKTFFQMKLFELIDRFFILIPEFRNPFLKNLQKSMVKLIAIFNGRKSESDETKLKHVVISIIVNWNENYGKDLPLIEFCLNFLRSKFREDVNNAEKMLKNKKKEARVKKIAIECERKRDYQHLVDVFKDNKLLIISSINTIENCFNILIPDVNDINTGLPKSSSTENCVDNEKILFPGIDDGLDVPFDFSGPSSKVSRKMTHEVSVNLSLENMTIEIYENSNNTDLLRTLKDEIAVLQKRSVPFLNNIIKKMKKFENSQKELESLYRLSWIALECVRKFDQLRIINNDHSLNLVSSDSEQDDFDFIDVP